MFILTSALTKVVKAVHNSKGEVTKKNTEGSGNLNISGFYKNQQQPKKAIAGND